MAEAKTLMREQLFERSQGEWIEFETILTDVSFKLSPHQFEDIDVWTHEFTEDCLYDLIMEYAGWTEYEEGMLEIQWDENRTIITPLWHLLAWLHGTGGVEGKSYQGDEVADRLLKSKS